VVPVQLSLGVPNFGAWPGDDPRSLLDVARAAEAAGVDRLVVSDHVVLGDNLGAYRWGRFPTAPDGRWLEPLTTLTAFAAVTSRTRLSTGILIAPLRPATVLAKTVATLDALSGGRVDLGVGVGWQREEYDAEGLDFTTRGDLLDETVAACRALWCDLPASYHGEHVSLAGVYCSPQPVQPRLPVWFSGTLTERTVRRIAAWGDGWIPIMGASIDDIAAGARRLTAACGRVVDVQAPLPLVRREDKSLDLDATLAHMTDLAAACVSNVYVNIASLATTPGDVPEALARFVPAFRQAAS
jgi:probable F420-dependent oxidoreductase